MWKENKKSIQKLENNEIELENRPTETSGGVVIS
jgi:hypothetical protein